MQAQSNIVAAGGRAFRSAAPTGEVSMTNRFASLAALMGLDPLAAVALPTTIEVAARKAGMATAAMLAECEGNAALRDYLARICREVDVVGALQ